MQKSIQVVCYIFLATSSLLITSCASVSNNGRAPSHYSNRDYEERLPQEIDTGGTKTVLVDPNVHAWGAYDESGHLVKGGIATAGSPTCPPDADHADCHTGTGTFRVTSLGDGECYSKTYPRPHGGGLMPYCMYFHNGQALHGSPDSIVVDDNLSHGCVRMRISDAEWMRYNFASVGTKVIVKPY